MGFVVFGLFLLGCEQKTAGTEETEEWIGIEVTPDALDFGTLSVYDSASIRTFTVASAGTSDLTVSSIEIQGDAASSFTLVSPFMETVLTSGESTDIQVAFLPDGANSLNAEAVVFSDDPDDEAVPVQLIGNGAIPDLVITPDSLNFEETLVGCQTNEQIILSNVGLETLDIFSVSSISDAFVINNMPSFPFSLQSNQEYVLDVSFTPDIEGTYSSSIEVISTDPEGAERTNLSGSAQYAEYHEESWENPVEPPVDILFSMDQSCSMADNHALLMSNFSRFISDMSNYTTDWQIMISNADNGCNNGGIYTSNTPNLETSFLSNIQTGGAGYYTESLLTIVSNAIENTDSGECNSGFLREEAMLHIIMISDVSEQSSNAYGDYVDQIIAKKGDSYNIRMSVILDPNHQVGRYTGAANNTNGLVFDIEDLDWASPLHLQISADAANFYNRYVLNHTPLEHTITVYVNGYEVALSSGNWHYDSGANAVVFDTNPPQEGETVTITYASPASCE